MLFTLGWGLTKEAFFSSFIYQKLETKCKKKLSNTNSRVDLVTPLSLAYIFKKHIFHKFSKSFQKHKKKIIDRKSKIFFCFFFSLFKNLYNCPSTETCRDILSSYNWNQGERFHWEMLFCVLLHTYVVCLYIKREEKTGGEMILIRWNERRVLKMGSPVSPPVVTFFYVFISQLLQNIIFDINSSKFSNGGCKMQRLCFLRVGFFCCCFATILCFHSWKFVIWWEW